MADNWFVADNSDITLTKNLSQICIRPVSHYCRQISSYDDQRKGTIEINIRIKFILKFILSSSYACIFSLEILRIQFVSPLNKSANRL